MDCRSAFRSSDDIETTSACCNSHMPSSRRRESDCGGRKSQRSDHAGGAERMEYRQLGGSGLKVPVLSLGTASMGGSSEFFKAFGGADVSAATRLVDICLDAGVTMFDSADVYSAGQAEDILGQALKGRRHQALI